MVFTQLNLDIKQSMTGKTRITILPQALPTTLILYGRSFVILKFLLNTPLSFGECSTMLYRCKPISKKEVSTAILYEIDAVKK
jgi:hypothetical protein